MGKNKDFEYLLIDGNWSSNPVAYCMYHKGALTKKQTKVHKCYKRRNGKGCVQLRDLKEMECEFEYE